MTAASLMGETPRGRAATQAPGLLDGHLQIQHRGFRDDPRIDDTIDAVAARVEALRAAVGFAAVTPRISAFVLASSHDRSVGAQLLGVALVGTFSSGIADVDRGLREVPLETVSEAFDLNDAAHAIVVRATSVSGTRAVAEKLREEVGHDDVVLEWNELIPGLEQAIELGRIFGQVLFAMVTVIVTISVFNGFVMTVFERLREFGTLLAIGMRPSTVIGLLQMEAGCLSVIGCAAGLAIGVPLVLWLEQVGIPLGDAGEMMRAFHMADRMYPTLNADVVLKPIVLMIVCTRLACLMPALRVRRMQPVEALRDA